MHIELKNIGMIKEAKVNLDGLTVIAGENDTGKSTVGKILFSIVKAISRYKEDLEEDKENKILNLIEKNYFELRRKINFSKNMQLRNIFYPPRLREHILKGDIELAIDERLEIVKQLQNENIINENIYNELYKKLSEIKKIIKKKENTEDIRKRAFKKVLNSEFKGYISNQYFLDEDSTIKLFEGSNNLLEVVIKKNKIAEFKVFDELYFADATFIESPILLQMSELIENAKSYFEDLDKIEKIYFRPNTVFHIKDLNNKLRESAYAEPIFELELETNDETLLNSIKEIIKGKIKYDIQKRDFIYINEEKNKAFYSVNTATGIKSFGIIQMLLKTGFINQKSLLIIDEPEVHLHPKWQLKYAELIVELVKNGIRVLVTSHSPYMIEALKRYSELKKIENKTSFYLAEEGYIKYQDSLENIFEKLAIPMRELKKLKMQRYLND